jgi:hypothetical protein
VNVYRVVTERDGAKTREPGRVTVDLDRAEYRFVSESIRDVWGAIDWLLDDPECEVIAIIMDHPIFAVIPAAQESEQPTTRSQP